MFFTIFELLTIKNYIKMKTQEDKILNFIDGTLTKIFISLVIVSLLSIVFYNGIILNGFSAASWGY